jgi:mono/diheme cytochrome c family protein
VSRRVLLLLLLAGFGCASPRPTGGPARPPDPARGKQVYLSNCIACHGADPAVAGPLGPPVKPSSRELIEARVLRGAYPDGYKPKRDTQLMKPLPQLAPDIDDLAAFLK